MEKTVHVLSVQLDGFLRTEHAHPNSSSITCYSGLSFHHGPSMMKLFVPVFGLYVNEIILYVIFGT